MCTGRMIDLKKLVRYSSTGPEVLDRRLITHECGCQLLHKKGAHRLGQCAPEMAVREGVATLASYLAAGTTGVGATGVFAALNGDAGTGAVAATIAGFTGVGAGAASLRSANPA